MAREPVRGAPRSVANLEFHRAGHEVTDIGAEIVAKLEGRSIRAVNPSMGFPMEMHQTVPWIVSHKPIAVEAGLGHMGIHRNLIHPKFGNFVILGTVLTDIEVEAYAQPIEYNPALNASFASLPAPSARSGRTARSISPPASPTTIVSSLAASPIGSSRSPIRAMPSTIAAASTSRRQRRCGRA
jgi:hypothetical protein